jgi:hypothetical protein
MIAGSGCRGISYAHIGGTEFRELPPSDGPTKVIRVLVALRIGFPPVVIMLTGTECRAFNPKKVYVHAKDDAARKKKWHAGDPMSGLGAEEYIDVLDEALQLLGYKGGPSTRSQPVVVWQDKSPAHTAGVVPEWLESKGLEEVRLPTCSPDLDPLDYGVFGAAKAHMNRWQWEQHLPWDDCCDKFLNYLRKLDSVEAVLQEVPLRLEACIKANGNHFDAALHELKHERAQAVSDLS